MVRIGDPAGDGVSHRVVDGRSELWRQGRTVAACGLWPLALGGAGAPGLNSVRSRVPFDDFTGHHSARARERANMHTHTYV